MNNDGFSLALLGPDIAVTSAGQIRKLQADDFEGFTKLAEEVSDLPGSGNGAGHGIYGERVFRVHHDVTCQPFTNLNILRASRVGEPLSDITSVYGFSRDEQGLEGGGKLPDVLWQLLGLLEEALGDMNGKVDEDVLKRIGFTAEW
jgi:hypothetical protein